MTEISLQIDGREVRTTAGSTVLEAARAAGIDIPTLCHHEALEPYGGCRLCLVEVAGEGWSRLVVSCVYPAADGLVVTTRNQRVDRLRKILIELLLAHAPEAPRLGELAAEYGADRNRFESEPSFCIHCGLCVRYCAEVKGAHAVGFVDRGIRKEIAFLPEVAALECPDCKACFPLCPTSYVQAAFVLMGAFASPGAVRRS